MMSYIINNNLIQYYIILGLRGRPSDTNPWKLDFGKEGLRVVPAGSADSPTLTRVDWIPGHGVGGSGRLRPDFATLILGSWILGNRV